MRIRGTGLVGAMVRRVFVGPAQSKVVLVVMPLVRGMAVTVVKVVDMVVVLHRRVTAVLAVLVLVSLSLEVTPSREPVTQGAV